MKATKTCVAAQRFQYDYLNDDIDDFGQIDYSLTNKVPAELRKAIKDGKKILVLINPPYAEATSGGNAVAGVEAESKLGVAKTKFAANAMAQYGKATNELFMQFVVRIAHEMPSARVAMFSKLKYISAPTLGQFRDKWRAKFLDGFVVSSKVFDGVSGNFPIGFLIWATNQNAKRRAPISEITLEVLDEQIRAVGEKSFSSVSAEKLLTDWIERPPANEMDAVPLKNASTPATATKDLRGTKWADGAIAWMNCAGNDLQNAGQKTMLFSSGYGSGRGFFTTQTNLWQTAIVFAVRRLIKATWLNDRDQFLQPARPLSEAFKTDCLIWMLFNGSNLTASADDLEWNGRKWSIVNHFIPFTENDVNATGRFESDFMVQYLAGKTLSADARAVLLAGRTLWQAYFGHIDVRSVRDELKLNRPDVGWYQIRNALKARNASGDTAPVDFTAFTTAYEALTDKLHPQVYELGFLR